VELFVSGAMDRHTTTTTGTAAERDADGVAAYDEWNETALESIPICNNLSHFDCLTPVIAKRLEISVPIYGYISPPVILLTLCTNSLICVVLLRRGNMD